MSNPFIYIKCGKIITSHYIFIAIFWLTIYKSPYYILYKAFLKI
ncbi:hypothetical protein [Plasmodium yoelii yoelii]|uniref:Uncharacterized protein n=1 Tax=Plasmodium yoelii yoelii TaxID=73239 RepID=Q7RCS3_PLAYO|nr:hypothetical protein [Plasmodium yoelii yoelii]